MNTIRRDVGFDVERGDQGSRAAFLAPGAFALEPEAADSIPRPLANALAPWCTSCWNELLRELPSPPRLLTGQAARDLEGALREDLARLLGPVLSVEMAVDQASDGDSKTLDALLREVIGSREGLEELWATYPVLERLCTTVTDRWVGMVRDLLTRLAADREDLDSLVPGLPEEPLLARVTWGERPAVSGHPELLVRFAAGGRARYVPRPLPSHAAFVRLLDEMSSQGAPHELRTARVVDRATHAWVEHVEPEPCRDPEETAHFCRRAGAWAFLAWWLRATDLGNRDFVACGAHPVLVRPRLLQHRWVNSPRAILGHTVLSTGLIGTWRLVDRKFWDTSVLPLGTRTGGCRVTASWSGEGDPLGVRFRMVPVEITDHLPHPKDRDEPTSAHAEQIIQGFRETYAWFEKHRQFWLHESLPFAELLHCPVDIGAYDRPGARLRSFRFTSPRLLEDETEHWNAAKAGSAKFLSGVCDGSPNDPPLIAADARATAGLSLPLLTALPRETNVRVEEEDGTTRNLSGFLAAPSAEEVRARLEGLHGAECEEQVRLLRSVLGPAKPMFAGDGSERPTGSPSPDWREEAVALAEHLVHHAAQGPGGVPTWLTVSERPSRGLSQLTPLPPDGLSSQGGVALFLAAVGRVAHRPDLRRQAFQALQPVRDQWLDDPEALRVLPNGAIFGLGSLIYTLTLFGRLTEDDDLIEDALGLARHATSERIQRDVAFDVYGGNAGLALALAALYERTREEWIAQRLGEVGEHLLAHRVQADATHRAWPSATGRTPLGGFSHGVAGISYALVRTFEIVRHEPLLDAAREAIAYEHGLFAPEPGQWRDLRMAGSFMCSWCHGAPGIALARASILGTLDEDLVRTDLERAVQATLDGPVENLDHVCCGNVGRVECLWVAANRLESARLQDTVLALAAQVHAKARARGRYAVDWPGTRDSPTFLRGLAGIGYQWLRLADPELPSVPAFG